MQLCAYEYAHPFGICDFRSGDVVLDGGINGNAPKVLCVKVPSISVVIQGAEGKLFDIGE